MIEHVLKNPPEGYEVKVVPQMGGAGLYIKYPRESRFKHYDGYTFRSVTSAKSYYSRYFSQKEKSIWEKVNFTIED